MAGCAELATKLSNNPARLESMLKHTLMASLFLVNFVANHSGLEYNWEIIKDFNIDPNPTFFQIKN